MALAQHYYGTGPGGDVGSDLDDLLDLLARGRPAWMADALCREYPEVNFFPALGESAEPAKAVCARCAVRAECAAYGATEDHGVWGGLSARGRSGANVGRVVSDGAPARLRVAPKPEPVVPKPPPPRKVRKPKPVRTWPRYDGPAPPAPDSCARCPMAVKKGKTLCKGCERAAGLDANAVNGELRQQPEPRYDPYSGDSQYGAIPLPSPVPGPPPGPPTKAVRPPMDDPSSAA